MDESIAGDEKKIADIKNGKLFPPMDKPPPRPQPRFTSPQEAWGSYAMLAAGIGSLFTRAPLTTALGAAAGVMDAFKANDLAAAKEQMDVWKVANENYDKQFKFEMEAKKDAIADYKKDENLAVAKLRAVNSAFGAVTGRNNEGNLEIHRALMDIENEKKTNIAMQKAAIQLQATADTKWLMEQPDVKKAIENAKTPAEKHYMTMALRGGMLPEDLRSLGERLWAGDETAIKDISTKGFGAGVRQAAMGESRIIDIERGGCGDGTGQAARDASYKGIVAAYRTLDTTSARISLGANEVANLKPQVLAASELLKRTQFKTLNAIIQAGEREHGDTELKDFGSRIATFKSAFSRCSRAAACRPIRPAPRLMNCSTPRTRKTRFRPRSRRWMMK